MAFASASASVNPNVWGWTKATIANRTAGRYASGALFRSPPIARTMSLYLVVARQKMSIIGAIAASGGRWSGRSVGSTSIDGWTACWNMARRLTAPSCESFSLNTIWMPYFPDPNEF